MPLCRKTSAVALGSNLGDSIATLASAARSLKKLELTSSFRCSPLFLTKPVGGPPNQPDFINAVVLFDWSDSPEQLLNELQQLENKAGRQRSIMNGPRTLDLDLLWCGAEQRISPILELPHPRLSKRRFVLEPLAAIDHNLLPPGQNLTVGELLSRLAILGCESPPQRIEGHSEWPIA